MFALNEFKVQVAEENQTQGIYRIEPLPKGYAHTLGTVLRRILLSSIPGAAITGIKLEGVQHEYSTIAGLHDDILAIVLAMKGVAVVSHSNTPITLSLSKKGKKGEPTVVTAGDMEKNSMIEVINPEYVITTLADEKASINAEITVSKGIGYAMPDESLREEVGVIPVDAAYSPIRLVSVESRNTRVGQQTDLDSLELKIVTNGAISPAAALHQATQILSTMVQHLTEVTAANLDEKSAHLISTNVLPMAERSVTSTKQSGAPLLVADLNLSTRLTNALLHAGYVDLRNLEGLTEEELRNIKGMGDKSFMELMDVVATHNIKLI